jgi:hypothetical protein
MSKKYKQKLFNALRFDLNFFRNNNLMDYSLLLAVEKIDVDIKSEALHLIGAPRTSVMIKNLNLFDASHSYESPAEINPGGDDMPMV